MSSPARAAVVAAAWSGPDAPDSWRLIAAQLGALRDDPELGALAASAPPDRLPALLFTAAATHLVLTHEPEPLRGWFPYVGEGQASLGDTFGVEYRGFCLDHRDELLATMAAHRYQMNEVGTVRRACPRARSGARQRAGGDVHRRLDPAPALPCTSTATHIGSSVPPRRCSAPAPAVRRSRSRRRCWGRRRRSFPSGCRRWCSGSGSTSSRLRWPTRTSARWLAACIPQTIEAVTRFERAVDVALSEPATMIRGDAIDVLDGRLCVLFPPTGSC